MLGYACDVNAFGDHEIALCRILWKGYTERIRAADVWRCLPEVRCDAVIPRFEAEWNLELKRQRQLW